ncbi:MAG: tetraacyldisaccharide 4'-kinase [Planctomycetota bacterium]
MNPLLEPILKPLSRVYASQIGKRNARFDRGEGVVTFDRPVISVGNLSVGGTGKTPMVRRIVKLVRDAGHDPCIAMRGYGSSRRDDGRSDEADEYAAAFEDLPIVAQPNRTEGLINLFGTERGERVDTIVLDDGFQHRRIARHLDIVLIDATRSPLSDNLLPLGRLREPLDSLARAQAVVITHTERASDVAVNDITRASLAANADLLIATSQHAWTGIDIVDVEHPLPWLAGKTVLPVCAIGNPNAFIESVRAKVGRALDPIVLRDHDPYAAATVRRIIREAAHADAIVTTAKDWAKLRGEDPSAWPCPVAVPKLQMQLVTQADAFDRLVLAAAAEPAEDTLDP